MKSIYDGYTTADRLIGDRAYFLGANTGDGFTLSPYTPFKEGSTLTHLYIIKGGVGTGKSSLMKKAAAEAAKRGIHVVAYYCGSDPHSLDGVVLNGTVGIADGTAPHVLEMRFPALSSSLVDVSSFLDGDRLQAHGEEITALAEKKSALYRSAHRYMKAAELLEAEYFETLRCAVDFPKLKGWAGRTAKAICPRTAGLKTEAPLARRMYTSAVSMNGSTYLDAFSHRAERICSIDDDLGVAHLLLEALGEACGERGLTAEYGIMPINGRVRELYFPEIGTLFAVNRGGEGIKAVNAHRFLLSDVLSERKGRLKIGRRCIEAMENEAAALLIEAGKTHFALEELNVAAMNFGALNRYCNRLISGIMEKLTTS